MVVREGRQGITAESGSDVFDRVDCRQLSWEANTNKYRGSGIRTQLKEGFRAVGSWRRELKSCSRGPGGYDPNRERDGPGQ
jgi:hypothetical protein